MVPPPDETLIELHEEWLAHPYTRRIVERLAVLHTRELGQLADLAASIAVPPDNLRIKGGWLQGLKAAIHEITRKPE